MFTIDLLKGAGKPPESRPLWAAGAALAFMVLAVAAALDGVQYFRDGETPGHPETQSRPITAVRSTSCGTLPSRSTWRTNAGSRSTRPWPK